MAQRHIKKLHSLQFLFLAAVFNTCGQSHNDRSILGRINAESELQIALSDRPGHNVISQNGHVITDSSTAIGVAEPILFGVYGKDNIKKQRPYEVYHLDKYWLIAGTLQKNMLGGTFLIIIDSRDAKVIKLTHGK